jgi:hypothetical protein
MIGFIFDMKCFFVIATVIILALLDAIEKNTRKNNERC